MEPLLSPHWFKVAHLRPALRRHVQPHRQTFGPRVRYLLQDRVTGKYHHFGEEAWELIRRLDGTHSVEEVWQSLGTVLGDRLPSQGETLRLIGQLLRADLIHCDDKRLAESLDDRRWRARTKRRLLKLASPLSIKVPLLDPDRFLERTRHWVDPLFSRTGFLAWIMLVMLGMLLAVVKLPELGASLSDRLLSAENLLLMALLYALIKLVHELGHAYALKRWGGEVHELGVMLLVFLPIPYVDASAAHAFPARRQRILVAAIGVMVELGLASIAMLVWTLAEPGLLRSLFFQVVVIAGLSSLVFNGNPLMRYDAYYVLAELMNEPALARKSGQSFVEVARSWLSGKRPETAFADYSMTERRMLVGYAIASFLYRTAVTLLIAFALVKSLPFFGVLLAVIAVLGVLGLPTGRLLLELWRNGSLGQAMGPGRRLASLATLLFVFLFALPLPLSTTVEGMVMPAEEASVRASAEGFVIAELVEPGALVDAGQNLLRLVDDEASVRLQLASSRLAEVQARVEAAVRVPLEGEVLRQEIAFLEQQVDEAGLMVANLDVTAPVTGRWFPVRKRASTGTYFKRGELLGLVIDPKALRLIAVVDEAHIQLVRDATTGIVVRDADGLGTESPSRVLRLMPEATHQLPHAALTTEGGGRISRNPEARDNLESIRRHFWVELDLAEVRSPCLDCRAQVRFSHPPEPLAWRLGRWLRRQFMSLLDA